MVYDNHANNMHRRRVIFARKQDNKNDVNMQALSEQLIALLLIMTGMLFTPLLFIALDYWAGIRKARKRGEVICSDKMKRTVDKISRYYNAILAMMVVDGIQMSAFIFLYLYYSWTAYTIPVFTLAAILFVAAIEIKSIYEPADIKEQREMKEVSALAKAIAAHKDDPKEIAEAIAQYLNKPAKGGTILDKDDN